MSVSDSERTRNSYTFGLALVAAGALACLALPWGEVQVTTVGGMEMPFNGMTMTITGTNGTISFAGIPVPTWFIAMLAAVGAVTALLQLRAVIAIPRLWALVPSAASALMAVLAMVVFAGSGGSVGFGVVLLLVVSVMTAVLVLRAPRAG